MNSAQSAIPSIGVIEALLPNHIVEVKLLDTEQLEPVVIWGQVDSVYARDGTLIVLAWIFGNELALTVDHSSIVEIEIEPCE